MAEQEWLDIATLPPPMQRQGRVFVVVQGVQSHSGMDWVRQRAGLARTQNDGFYQEDISAIEREDHMNAGSGVVTHWMPYRLPAIPHPT